MKWLPICLGIPLLLVGCNRDGILTARGQQTEKPAKVPSTTMATSTNGNDSSTGAGGDAHGESTNDEESIAKARIDALEKRLLALENGQGAPAGTGRGAYRSGSTLRINGTGTDSLLQRMYDLERALDLRSSDLAIKGQELETMQQRLLSARALASDQEAQLAGLSAIESKWQTAVQEFQRLKTAFREHEARLTASELERLRVQRAYYELAHEIIAMRIDETQRLRQLQIGLRERLRGEAAEFRPQDVDASISQGNR